MEQFLANGEALLPFEGLSVYYSGSISGGPELDLSLPRKLVEYMQQGGAVVLDPFVAIPSKLEPDAFLGALAAAHNLTVRQWQEMASAERNGRIYRHDIGLVERASHVVALLNGPSPGVGMELQHAFNKPLLGLNETPVLGLVHASIADVVPPIVQGAACYYPLFHLERYTNAEEAQQAIYQFLLRPR